MITKKTLRWPRTQPAGRYELGRDKLDRELNRRLNGPQRHRLLQGYPMLPLMVPAAPPQELEAVPIDTSRQLIVGVLPHPFCNPQVSGCGFCTFPHEMFRRSAAEMVTATVTAEIEARCDRLKGIAGRPVDALYFGGGTANLTPPNAFSQLCAALDRRFDLSGAEISLEGVPIYFLARKKALLRILAEELAGRHRRISMGVQTFDPDRLKAMGRSAFGGRDEVARVVEAAHQWGMTASGDLLINLPHQDRDAMLEDLRVAMAVGLDQICLYHLVLFEGLGTPWSRDPAMLAGLPTNPQAFANWQAARQLLLEGGYVQTTLTNFERAELVSTDRRFQYEELSFRPRDTDAIGFGPSGISTFTDQAAGRAVKIVNAAGSGQYQQAMQAGAAYERQFVYAGEDLELLHLTRSLARMRVLRDDFEAVFGRDLMATHGQIVRVLETRGLVELTDQALSLTERGMFFADSVAGLLAWPRLRWLRDQGAVRGLRTPPLNELVHQPMG